MHSPSLNFFRNLFRISKLECLNSAFFRTPSINNSGVIVHGKSPWALFLEEFHGVVFQGGNYSGKNVRGLKSKEQLPWGDFMRSNFLGSNSPEENYSGVYEKLLSVRQKSWEGVVITLSGISLRAIVWEVVVQGGII